MVVIVTKDEPAAVPVHVPVLAQAPVKALDPDGIGVTSVGTAAFAVATALCWVFRTALAASHHTWFLWVAATGTALGLIALALGLVSGRRRRRSSADDASPTGTDDQDLTLPEGRP